MGEFEGVGSGLSPPTALAANLSTRTEYREE
jgi:hypothetical protein